MFIASLIKFNSPFVHSMRKNKNSKRKQKLVPRKKHKRTKITRSHSATINDFLDDILTISPSVESINDFSDEILCHILSFLPINEAFRTTVLCKRWLPLCYSLSVLYNDDNVKNHLPQFMNSVMLSPHSQHKTLKSLTLKFHSCSKYLDDKPPDWFTFDIWMEAAKQRNLEKLDIYYLLGIPLVPTIFSCKTLVVLRLTGINVATMFRCSVDLPVLKALYLSDVCFKHMEDFMKLLSGCPKLLDLQTRDVMATTGITTGGCFKPLSKLLHADIGLFEVPLRAVSNVEFLTLTKQWMWESLLDEEINSYYKGYPVFENLTILRLIWYDCDIILDWEYMVVTMLQNCPKLQDLCMSKNAKLLQVMKIHYSKNRNSMERPQFIEDLSSYPRISPVCELSIIPR